MLGLGWIFPKDGPPSHHLPELFPQPRGLSPELTSILLCKAPSSDPEWGGWREHLIREGQANGPDRACQEQRGRGDPSFRRARWLSPLTKLAPGFLLHMLHGTLIKWHKKKGSVVKLRKYGLNTIQQILLKIKKIFSYLTYTNVLQEESYSIQMFPKLI